MTTPVITYVDTDFSPGGDGSRLSPYSSLNEWQTVEGPKHDSLISEDITMTVICSGSQPDTTSANITGWVTDSTHTITVTTVSDDPSFDFSRHTGVEGTGYVLYPSEANYGIQVNNDDVIIDGIEIFERNSISNALIRINTGTFTNVTIKNCILHGKRGHRPNTAIVSRASGNSFIYNNFIYDIGFNDNSGCIRKIGVGFIYAYNNTLVNSMGFGIRKAAGTIIAKNNLAANCDISCFDSELIGDDGDYNASDDDTSTGGSNDRINQEFSFVSFDWGQQDPSFSIPDLHLEANDTGARGWGISLLNDPFISFSTDIDGDIRGGDNPSTGSWDIGADEFTEGPSSSSSSSLSSSSSNSSSSSSLSSSSSSLSSSSSNSSSSSSLSSSSSSISSSSSSISSSSSSLSSSSSSSLSSSSSSSVSSSSSSTNFSYIITRSKDGSDFVQVGQTTDTGATTITFDNDFGVLGDGIYCYKAYGVSQCGDYSPDGNTYCFEVLNGLISIFPQNDITDLRVQPTTAGKFLVYFKIIYSDIQNPSHFNIYSAINPIINPSGVEDNPSDFPLIDWNLDGRLEYFRFTGFYVYTTEKNYTHGDEVIFRVYPATEDGSIQFERENDLTVNAIADAEGPIITSDVVDIDFL